MESNSLNIIKKDNKDLKLYKDFSKNLNELRIVEFKSNCKVYNINYAKRMRYFNKINDKKLLKRLSERLNISILL